jgi:deoxyribonuclease-4
VNDSRDGLGSNRDRHENVGEGVLGEKLGAFLSRPRLQGLPAVLEVPGRDGKGADAEEVGKLKELHARATKRATAKARR